jgi:hypothetical protein
LELVKKKVGIRFGSKENGSIFAAAKQERRVRAARQKFTIWLVYRVLKRNFKEISKKFGSLEMIFTFAAAKTKKSSLKRMGVKLGVCDPVIRKV